MDVIQLFFYFFIIIPSAIIHEYSHGWMAERLGDPTARYAGRLTLNPRAHIDVWGTILLPLLLFLGTGGRFLFAYAKPVPYNPYNLHDQKWGPALVGLAGPAANFILAAGFAIIFRLLPVSAAPLAPFLLLIIQANVVLMVFNLVPLPPLDGSKLLYALLPAQAQKIHFFFERYGILLLFIFIFFFFQLLYPIIDWLMAWLVGY